MVQWLRLFGLFVSFFFPQCISQQQFPSDCDATHARLISALCCSTVAVQWELLCVHAHSDRGIGACIPAFASDSGLQGTVLAMVSSPSLARAGGWPLIFYVSGGFGVVWLILFGLLASRSPETHPYISRAERDHIVGTRRATLGDAGAASGFCEVPWTAFFRHPPFWGTVTAHFCYNYMSFLALSLGARQHQNTSFGL